MRERHPFKQYLNPEEVASLAEYLLSAKSKSISGQVKPVYWQIKFAVHPTLEVKIMIMETNITFSDIIMKYNQTLFQR